MVIDRRARRLVASGATASAWTVASVGDVDGDGEPEIAVGNAGSVTIYRSSFSQAFGPPLVVLTASAANDTGAFGSTLQ